MSEPKRYALNIILKDSRVDDEQGTVHYFGIEELKLTITRDLKMSEVEVESLILEPEPASIDPNALRATETLEQFLTKYKVRLAGEMEDDLLAMIIVAKREAFELGQRMPMQTRRYFV